MGTPTPPPIPPDPVPAGELCTVCWGEGKEFGNVDTPSSVQVEIDGVAKGPNWVPADGDPPNGTYDVPQFLIGGPCVFSLVGAINVDVLFTLGSTVVTASITGGFSFFISADGEECSTVVSSNLNDHFTEGTATITLPSTT